jgi:hypothetical protein
LSVAYGVNDSLKWRCFPNEIDSSQSWCIADINSTPENNWLLHQPEIDFWMRNISLSEDSFLVVDQNSRSVMDVLSKKAVLEIEKGGNLKCLGQLYRGVCFDTDEAQIKFVRGRASFFDYAKIAPKMNEAFQIFSDNKVNPIYAQLLLLIESPNNSKAISSAGAVGHFQLMPSVAKKYGLKVNTRIDERTNFSRSAMASAKLFKYYCIPNAVKICNQLELTFDDADLWFQLLVLHVYNAGAGNVKKAALLHQGVSSGTELIQKLWHTKLGAFGNSSQNYSQLCLASYRTYARFVQNSSVTIVTNDTLKPINSLD